MYSTEQFEKLEQEERILTEEAATLIFLSLGVTRDELEKEIRNFYQKYGQDGVVTYKDARKWVSEKDHRKRLLVLFLTIGDKFETRFNEIESNLRSHLRSIILSEIEFFDLDVDLFDIDKILNMTWGVDDLNWNHRLWQYQEKWATVISNDLKIAFLKRKDVIDVLKDLEKRFLSMEKILWRLYITESTAVGSLARREIFKELGIKQYQYYAREDERTCEQCGALHGLIFPITAYEVGVTASPIHSHCRCWEVPIMD